jgi:hypothetical protein
MTTRRALLSAIPALICAPAIVRVSSLMPVKAWRDPFEWLTFDIIDDESPFALIATIKSTGRIVGTIVEPERFAGMRASFMRREA